MTRGNPEGDSILQTWIHWLGCLEHLHYVKLIQRVPQYENEKA